VSFPVRLLFSLTVLAALMFMSGPASAQSGCPQFPQVSWWGNTTHTGVRNYVKKKHRGDWKPYISKWENQLRIMRSIQGRGKGAVIRNKGITLKGAALGAYIGKIDERIKVTRCLAREDETKGRSVATQKESLSVSPSVPPADTPATEPPADPAAKSDEKQAETPARKAKAPAKKTK